MSKFSELDWENIDVNDIRYYQQLIFALAQRGAYLNDNGNFGTILQPIFKHGFKSYQLLNQLIQALRNVISDGWINDDISFYNDILNKDDNYWKSSDPGYEYLKIWTEKSIIEKTGVNYYDFTPGDVDSYKNVLVGIKKACELLTKQRCKYCAYSYFSGGDTTYNTQETLSDFEDELFWDYDTSKANFNSQLDVEPTRQIFNDGNAGMGDLKTFLFNYIKYQKMYRFQTQGDQTYFTQGRYIGFGVKIKYLLKNKNAKLKRFCLRKLQSSGSVDYPYQNIYPLRFSILDTQHIFSQGNEVYEQTLFPDKSLPQPVYSNPIDEDGDITYYKNIDSCEIALIFYVDFAVDNGFEYY